VGYACARGARAAVAALGMLWLGHAVAADSESSAPCNQIFDDAERLACYDRVNGFVRGRLASESPVSAVPVERAEAEPADAPSAAESLIDRAWAFEPEAERYALRYYRPNYLLFARYTDDVNQAPFSPVFEAAESDEQLDDVEARFQLSFKGRVLTTDDHRWGLWLAYTQMSQWQVYSEETSRPFRETNYEPEVFVSYRPDVELGSFDWRLLNIGYNHQSNGRSQVLSRSWDRLFAEIGVERERFGLLARAWYRIPEDSDDDDNPDINRYMGYGDVTGIYKWRDHSFSLMARGNWNTHKGAVRFAWVTPPLLGPIRGYVQAFSGYGDSMIDYNWSQNIIGVGITVNDAL
jgi:phospholipase A1/A2